MATRIYCDNCGNTITNPNRYCFGPYRVLLTPQQAGVAVYGSGGGGSAGVPGVAQVGQYINQGQPNNPNAPQVPIEMIDLCDGCQTIWMDRVRKLTRESEPSA